jgi:zinc protease
VGDFDPAEVERLAGQLLGDWKTPTAVARPVRTYQEVPTIARTIATPDKANATFAAGMPIPITDEDPDYPALMFANYMFGMGSTSRLLQRILHKEGWSYGGYSQILAPEKDNAGFFSAMAILAPQNMDKLVAGFQEELGKALESGFTEDELERAKTSWTEQQAVLRAQDRGLLDLLSVNEYWGRRLSWQADLESKVRKLSAPQVNAAWKKYIRSDAISVVRAGDFRNAGP